MKVYILDTRQIVGNCALWWAPDGKGYTCEIDKAGLYDAGYANRNTDVEIPEEIAKSCTVSHVRVERLREEMDKAGIKWPLNKQRRR